MIHIDTISSKNIHQVLLLIDQFDRQKSPPPDLNCCIEILNELERQGGAVIGAFTTDQKIVGTCTLNICSNLSWSGRPYAMIENVIVDRIYRGQGIGKAVLKYAEEKARAAGCYKVSLMTGSKRDETLMFYQSAGFTSGKTAFQIRF